MFETRLPLLKETLYENGRADDGFRVSNFVAWHIRKDRESSFAEARRELIVRGWLERDWLEPFLTAEETESILNNRWAFLKPWLERHGEIEGVPKHVVDTLVEELSLSGNFGDIEGHMERFHAFEEAGFTVCDMIVKVRTGPMMSSKWKHAHHARKRHCFWIICRNGKSCERLSHRNGQPRATSGIARPTR